ncbi:MAG: hypothetical protein KAZ30_00245 [Candidatus Magasanikbacteria bacterium]|nr:hypothetical protein [Candidatus Magasanikbacteria bacterium]
MANEPKYFLEEFAEKVLTDLGIDNLNDTERSEYLPGIVHNLEIRLGAALLPFVPTNASQEFQELTDSDPTPQEWADFWKKHVPDYEVKAAQALEEFKQESREIFTK